MYSHIPVMSRLHDIIHMFVFVAQYRRFTPEQTSDMEWAKERSHECYVKKYSIAYPHDQYLAGRNLKQDPFFQASVNLQQIKIVIKQPILLYSINMF